MQSSDGQAFDFAPNQSQMSPLRASNQRAGNSMTKPLTLTKKPPTGRSLEFAPKSFRSIKLLDKFGLAQQPAQQEPEEDEELNAARKKVLKKEQLLRKEQQYFQSKNVENK